MSLDPDKLIQQLNDEVEDLRARNQLLLEERDVLRERIEKVATAPYCSGCGKVNHGAPVDIRRQLYEAGIEGCSPSNCPHWVVNAVFDHDTREWVAVDATYSKPAQERG